MILLELGLIDRKKSRRANGVSWYVTAKMFFSSLHTSKLFCIVGGKTWEFSKTEAHE